MHTRAPPLLLRPLLPQRRQAEAGVKPGRGGRVAPVVFLVIAFATATADVRGGLPLGEDDGLIAEFVGDGGVQDFEQIVAYLDEAAKNSNVLPQRPPRNTEVWLEARVEKR